MGTEYCPHCGADQFIRLHTGARLLCVTCGAALPRQVLIRARIRAELPRLVVASVWLARRQGDMTRAELARHLGLANSPYFRAAVDDLVNRGLLVVSVSSHPQNGRAALFYRRPGPWTRTDSSRACWSAGAVV